MTQISVLRRLSTSEAIEAIPSTPSTASADLDVESGLLGSKLKHDDSEANVLPLYAPSPLRASTLARGAPSRQRPSRDDPPVVAAYTWPQWLTKPIMSIPSRSRRLGKALRWIDGPESVTLRYGMITPLRPFARTEPILERLFAPVRSPVFLWPFLFVWLVGFGLLMQKSADTSAGAPSFIGAQSTFWYRNDACGIDGQACEPFTNTTTAFRCGARSLATQLLNNRAVGDQELIFDSLVVGGGDAQGTYRGDSWICQAAIHAGLFNDAEGGCGVVKQVGGFAGFVGSLQNGIQSTTFNSQFPSAFRFSAAGGVSNCTDLGTYIIVFNALLVALLWFLFRPPPIYEFWALSVVGFWTEALINQDINAVSTAMARWFPTMVRSKSWFASRTQFFLYAIWRCSFRFCLPYFEHSTIEKTILFQGPFWVGLLSQYTFDKINLPQRLLPEDIAKQPGSLVVLIVLIVIIVVIAINQLRVIRKTGWLPQYLCWYILGGIAFGLLCTAPHFTFRLHHWLLALVLLPGTAFSTRLSAIYQGLLLGLFLNDAALFGFDTILATAAELRGDAAIGSDLPAFLNSTINWAWQPGTSALVSFMPTPANISNAYDGFELLVDDVLRYSGQLTNFTIPASLLLAQYPHYLRLAYTASGVAGDFTRAAVLNANGTWTNPAAGPS